MSILTNYYSLSDCINELIIKQFTKDDLIDGWLRLLDALPGDVVVINQLGKVINTAQKQYLDSNNNCIGVDIDLSSQEAGNKWKVRYHKMKDINTSIQFNGNFTTDDLIKYSLIFN